MKTEKIYREDKNKEDTVVWCILCAKRPFLTFPLFIRAFTILCPRRRAKQVLNIFTVEK
jgi:hypothetical protein